MLDEPVTEKQFGLTENIRLALAPIKCHTDQFDELLLFMNQAWFEMEDTRRRRFANAVWIPLRAAQETSRGAPDEELGHQEEYFGSGGVAFPLANRAIADELSWTDLALRTHRVRVTQKGYKRADAYTLDDITDIGMELVLAQSAGGGTPPVWHLNQELVFALGLYREGDNWLCASEDFAEVAHLKRNAEGLPIILEMRADYLRDYLAARSMAVRLATYRSRSEIVADASHIKWPDDHLETDKDGGHLECRVSPIHEDGMPFGSSISVFHIGRTDVDAEVDVPRFDPPNDKNTESEQWTVRRTGNKLCQIDGEFWRDEWVEPAPSSPRVRGDRLPSTMLLTPDEF